MKLNKYLNDKKNSDISNLNDHINNLRNDLESATKRAQAIESTNFVRILQHLLSYLIFGTALMIDYKGKLLEKYIY